MAFIIRNGLLGAQQIASHGTVKNHPLGSIVIADDPTYGSGEFIYLKGLDDTVVGSWVTYNMDDGSTTLLAANAIGPVAVAMAATVTGEYGWYQLQGKAVAKVSEAVDDNDNLFATSTAGSVGDTVVAGDRVWGVKAASATTGAGSIDVEIARPFMDDGLNSGST